MGTAGSRLGRVARLSLVALVASLALAPLPAHAAFPGANGKIAFGSDRNVTPSDHCAPGGNKLACADIWTMNGDGTQQTLVQSGGVKDKFPPYPAWSSDGREIAFAHDYRPYNHETDIFAMDTNG